MQVNINYNLRREILLTGFTLEKGLRRILGNKNLIGRADEVVLCVTYFNRFHSNFYGMFSTCIILTLSRIIVISVIVILARAEKKCQKCPKKYSKACQTFNF